MATLFVSQLTYREPRLVGRIETDGFTFSYDSSFLACPYAAPLSCSLPLRGKPYAREEFRPYFEGLLAEGASRQMLAAELGVREDDWLSLLAACGRDCIGDVLIADQGDVLSDEAGYAHVDGEEIRRIVRDLSGIAEHNAEMRLSLAGVQGKTGLAHDPSSPITEGWLLPDGVAATTHMLKTSPMRDVPEIEFLCMKAARACGLDVADVSLLGFGNPVLAVRRFDRRIVSHGGAWHVERLHQEDLCQAFGETPGSKYAEIEGSSIRYIATFLRERSARPLQDVASFARQLLFSYAIGNCDAHLKNYSLLHRCTEGQKCRLELSPAYDLVCTTFYPKFSRNMAMGIGGVRDIDDVAPETLIRLAWELDIRIDALRRIAQAIADGLLDALACAGEGAYGPVLESTPYIAEDLIADIAPRVKVLRSFASGLSG